METSKSISYFKGNKETKVDDYFIKNEMAQFLQLDNLNFLVGAGCSSNIVDGTELGIPGMASLYSGFLRNILILKLQDNLSKKFLMEIWKRCLKLWGQFWWLIK